MRAMLFVWATILAGGDLQLAVNALLLGMLVGQDRIKRLFGVPCEERDAGRAARIVD